MCKLLVSCKNLQDLVAFSLESNENVVCKHGKLLAAFEEHLVSQLH